ncbi:MAG: sugar ABC transporter permease [Firmicutes bacterium]|nr:sugar ABC transporter permease [Bacillota bacterium]
MEGKGSALSNVASFFRWIGNDLKEIGATFKNGDWKTRVSFVIMGFGQLLRKQYVRGIALLASEAAMLWFIFGFGMQYLKDLGTLGTSGRGFNPDGTVTYGDNSFFILLYGILTIIAIALFLLIWRINVKDNKTSSEKLKNGEKLPSNLADLRSLLDEHFDKTLLALPVLGIFVFTVLPILFMIFVSFTNYDYDHQPPAKLFTWVGFENFKNILSFGGDGFGKTFFTVLGWTLIWAFFATFTNYFLGIAVALLINKKGIKFKKLWRTILVMTIAVPQFVSLLYVGKMFAADGLINSYLMKWGWIDRAIPFWTDKNYARVLIIVINTWIGIPYIVLIATGLLMNIPADLYEAARIDGANTWQMFWKITMPYMFFVTGPFLLTQFTGNLNNFNVIFLLNQGHPQSMALKANAGYTDLLVTWLYKMTVNDSNYKMASVIGIMVFIVTAVISLVVYNILPSVKDEEGFQ